MSNQREPTPLERACFTAFHGEPPSVEDVARYSATDATSRVIWKYPLEAAAIIKRELEKAVPARWGNDRDEAFNECRKLMGLSDGRD